MSAFYLRKVPPFYVSMPFSVSGLFYSNERSSLAVLLNQTENMAKHSARLMEKFTYSLKRSFFFES